jgi:uncharacterized protein
MDGVSTRLLVSLSGITAATLDRSAALSAELVSRGVPLSLLVAPRVAGADQPDAVRAWLAGRTAAGDAFLLHGYDHAPPPGRRRRAEFATLPAHEAGLRLTAAGAALERLGLVADGFVPPRWLVSPGTLTALRAKGFRLCADAYGIRDMRTGTVYKGRVQGFGVAERAEPWRCLAVVMAVARTARRGGLVRLAADTADLARPGPRQALLDAVDVALGHGAVGQVYPDLLTTRSARAA